MTSNADRFRYLHRLVPLALAGDPTGAAPSAAQPIEDARLVSEANPYGTRRVAKLLKRIAGGAIEDEIVEAERERRRTAAAKIEARRERFNALRREARAAVALTREPTRAPTVRRACDCGCGEAFDARPGQRFVDMKHKQRVKNRKARAAKRAAKRAAALAFGGAA